MDAEDLRAGAAQDGVINPALGPVRYRKGCAGAVFGYNHDISYAGNVYHVQTEDSGRDKGHVFTHVFRSGVIVASRRVLSEAAGIAVAHPLGDRGPWMIERLSTTNRWKAGATQGHQGFIA